MRTRWQTWTLSIFVASLLAAAGLAPAARAAEEPPPAKPLSFTLLAGRSGEPGRLGLRLDGDRAATLDAWIDFDGDGFFDEGPERVLDRVPVAPGVSVQPFELPDGAVLSAASRIRLRLVGDGGALREDFETLAFPPRWIDPGCNWAPGFSSDGLNGAVLGLEVFGGALYAAAAGGSTPPRAWHLISTFSTAPAGSRSTAFPRAPSTPCRPSARGPTKRFTSAAASPGAAGWAAAATSSA